MEEIDKGKIIYHLLETLTDDNPQMNSLIKEYNQRIEDFMPDYLYKYYSYSEYSIKNLVDGTVCFSNPNLFNDPFDSGAVFSHQGEKDRKKNIDDIILRLKVFSSLDTNVEYIYNELINRKFFDLQNYRDKNILLREILNNPNNLDIIRESHTLETIKIKVQPVYFNTGDPRTNRKLSDISENARVFCLSGSENNPLMWAHYGKNDTGICLKYKKQDILEFLRKNINNHVYLVPVYYTNENYINDDIRLSDTVYKLLQHFMAKKIDWNYECEWRLVRLCPNYSYNPFFYDNIVAGPSAPCNYPDNYVIPFIEPDSVYLGAKFSLDNLDGADKGNLEEMFLKYLRRNQFKIKRLSFCKQLLGYNIENALI